MPATKQACPMLIKGLLIAVYRLNSFNPGESTPLGYGGGGNSKSSWWYGGVFPALLPLGVVVMVWFVMCLPSLLTNTRCRTGTMLHLMFGVFLSSVYWCLICATVRYQKNLSVLAGLTAATHFAWFSAPAHRDTINGAANIKDVMRLVMASVIYHTLTRSTRYPNVPDGAYIITVWAPEIISMVLDPLFAVSVLLVQHLYDDTLVREVHTNDKDD